MRKALFLRSLTNSIAVVASLGVQLMLAPHAQSEIVYRNPDDLTASPGEKLIPWGVADGEWDFSLFFVSADPELPIATRSRGSQLIYSADGVFAAKLEKDTLIGTTAFFIGGGFMENHGDGPWAGGGTGYIGFHQEFPQDVYGWAYVTYDDGANTLTLHDYAYESSGEPIAAGDRGPCALESLVEGLPWPGDDILRTIRRFRDDVLAGSADGRELINAYYAHSAELKRILREHPRLALETLCLVGQLLPAMKQSTDKPRISRRLDKAGRQLVSRYAQYASPELRKALRSVRAAIRERTFFVVELERPAQDVGRRGVSIASVGHTLPPSREVSLRFLNR